MIKVSGLVKHFGPIRAVDGVSFEVEKGEVLGFLGPNGAGKSTTMKVLTCFFPPTAGTASVKGHDILTSPIAVRESLGFLPENAPLYDDMTVDAFLQFIARVRGYRGAEIRGRIGRVYEICSLKEVSRQPIHTLSKGFRQRVCFAQALIHDPEILILDEPTDGLDPNQKQTVRDMICAMGESKAIILSTHILEEVDAVCTRAIIISSGKIKFDGKPHELRAKSEVHGAVVITLAGGDEEAIKTGLWSVPGVKRVERIGDSRLKLRCYPEPGKSISPGILAWLKEKDLGAEEFALEQGRLDEVFRRITSSN
ncbi:MAG: ATP-binding cassette domain-containing protein [Planctomycetes bacterium]|nr:ATP-binding cassette domain-containing protein [Planctomycetota bacterium]